MMVPNFHRWKEFLYCLFSLNACTGFTGLLDIDEINNVNYGIEISKEPVMLKDEGEIPVDHIHLTSKFGQRYQCYFPDQVETEKKTEEKEKEALETGIPELLKPLETGPCLLKAKDWWSYEFCFGKFIRQFHVEDGKISGEIIYLGYFDWEKKLPGDEESNDKLNRYHSQSYVNGSKCDLTGTKRKTEVRFICDEGTGDHIGRIDEPETCSYVMTVHTNKICHHPYLKPVKQTQAVPITCNPVLDQDQYNEYQRMVEEEEEKTRLLEEERKKLKEDGKLDYADPTLKDDTGFKIINEDGSITYMDQYGGKTSSLSNALKDAELKVKVQVINSMEDLEKVFKDLKNLDTSKLKDAGSKAKDSAKDTNVEDDSEVETLLEEEDEDEKEEGTTDDTSTQEKETLVFKKSKPRDKSKSIVKDALEDIDETEDTGSVADKTSSVTDENVDDNIFDDEDEEENFFKQFDKGFDDPKFSDLKSKLQHNKESLTNLQSQVKDAVQEELDNIIEEAEDEVGVDLEDKKKSYQHLTQTLDKLLKRLDSTQEELDRVDRHIEEATEEFTAASENTEDLPEKPQGPVKDGDDRVKVRVTRVNRKDLQKSGGTKEGSDIETVESQLKDELEKAGLDLGGGSVQVKIITAGYYDKNGEPIKTLSAQDSDAFKDMVSSILGGDHEAAAEANKQEEQEENYSFVWQGRNRKQKVIES